MAKKIRRHLISFKLKMAKVWAYIEESQYRRAQQILQNHRYWE
jgi:hypothetical protein